MRSSGARPAALLGHHCFNFLCYSMPAGEQPAVGAAPAPVRLLRGLFVRVKLEGQYQFARVQQQGELQGQPALAVQASGLRVPWAACVPCCGTRLRLRHLVWRHTRLLGLSCHACACAMGSVHQGPQLTNLDCRVSNLPSAAQLPTDQAGVDGVQVQVTGRIPVTTVSSTNSLDDANWEALGKAELQRLAAYMQRHGLELPLAEVRMAGVSWLLPCVHVGAAPPGCAVAL